MKIGLIPINVAVNSAQAMIATAKKAEAVGFESVWTFEHVIVPVEYQSRYPYSNDGKMGIEPDANFVDPLISITALAQHTTRLKFGTGVNILPQTNPLLLAKQAASIDMLCNGRFMLGLGIGWLQEEYVAMGTPFEKRGARFDDYVQAMRKVWSGETVSHQSEFLNWEGFKSYPIPASKNRFPIHIGGAKGKAFERIAKYGDGWYAPTNNIAALGELMSGMTKACQQLGRNPDEIEISCMWIPQLEGLDTVKRYQDLGVSRLIVPAQSFGTNPLQALDKFAEDFIAKL